MKNIFRLTTAATLLFAGAAFAMPMEAVTDLDDSTRCGAGNASNNIKVTDVTGNAGGATECWGTYDGNDSKDYYNIGTDRYDWVVTANTPGDYELANENEDPNFTGDFGGGLTSGDWKFDGFGGDSFLIVLKAASKPGFGVWLFDGAAANSVMGTWLVAWGNPAALSHISIYRGPAGNHDVPEPGTLALLGLGLVGLGAARRRKVA